MISPFPHRRFSENFPKVISSWLYSRTMSGLLVLAVICLLFYLVRSLRRPKEPSRGVTVTMRTYDPEEYRACDEAREKWLRERHPEADKWIHSKVAGVSHRNLDGTSRHRILRNCTVPEDLRIAREAHNPVDPKAMAVYRVNGQQLGYLSRPLATEIRERIDRGEQWQAVLTEITGKDQRTLGSNIELYRHGNRPPFD